MANPSKGAKLYIAGPMTNQPDWNFPLFFETAELLRSLGYEPNNPAENDGPDAATAVAHANAVHREGAHKWADYMRRDVVRLVSCDGIVLLPGWQQSRGARLEAKLAYDLDMAVFELRGRAIVRLLDPALFVGL